jgi:hypothetical protein
MTSKVAGIAIFALTLAQASAAIGATGNIAGTYIINFTELCQAVQKETVTTDNSGTSDPDRFSLLQSIQNGAIRDMVGYATFTPTHTGALSGSLSIVASSTNGSSLVTGLPGPPATPPNNDMTMTTGNASAPETASYSITLGQGLNPSSITLNDAGKIKTYSTFVGQLVSGVYNHFEWVGTDIKKGSKACSVRAAGQRR